MTRLPFAAAAMIAVAATGCAHRGEGDSQRRDAGNPVMNAAATPLRDVGLIRPDVPEILQGITYPYSTNTLASGCPAILYEIGRLDAVLGEETFQPGEERSLVGRGMDAAGNAGVNAVAGAAADIIPYRGWVRRLSGASRAEREAGEAYDRGDQRRTFLRGYGAALGCPSVVPAPPPPPRPRR